MKIISNWGRDGFEGTDDEGDYVRAFRLPSGLIQVDNGLQVVVPETGEVRGGTAPANLPPGVAAEVKRRWGPGSRSRS